MYTSLRVWCYMYMLNGTRIKTVWVIHVMQIGTYTFCVNYIFFKHVLSLFAGSRRKGTCHLRIYAMLHKRNHMHGSTILNHDV